MNSDSEVDRQATSVYVSISIPDIDVLGSTSMQACSWAAVNANFALRSDGFEVNFSPVLLNQISVVYLSTLGVGGFGGA